MFFLEALEAAEKEELNPSEHLCYSPSERKVIVSPWGLERLITKFTTSLRIKTQVHPQWQMLGVQSEGQKRQDIIDLIATYGRRGDVDIFLGCISAHMPQKSTVETDTSTSANHGNVKSEDKGAKQAAPNTAAADSEGATADPKQTTSRREANCNDYDDVVNYMDTNEMFVNAHQLTGLENTKKDLTLEDVVNKLFDLAVKKGKTDMARYLVESKRADVNHTHLGYTTPLQCAIRTGKKKHIQFLLELGADPNLDPSSHKVYSPLTAAARLSDPYCVKMLLKAGAHAKTAIADCWNYIYRNDISNFTQDYEAIIKLMLAAGANVNVHPNGQLTSTRPIIDILLFAAGERNLSRKYHGDKIINFSPEDWNDLDLKNQCRKVIRKHLLTLDPHTNLFMRIPLLGKSDQKPSLSCSLVKYLLYSQGLNIDWSEIPYKRFDDSDSDSEEGRFRGREKTDEDD